jgi:ABC-2 type transport system ATP-binding protein
MIEWCRLTKRYARSSTPALNALQLEVNDGEVVGLVGLNGAGKTTAIRTACGVTLPSAGTVRIDGRDIIKEKSAASERIGWVPELPNCDPDQRALSTLRYFAGFYGTSGSSATVRCRELLKAVGLEGKESLKLRRFSQGMFKRFNLAAAIIGDPGNLLLDEILSGLDPDGIQFVRSWIHELKIQSKAVLLSSHQLTEVQQIADRVAILHRGRLLRVIRRGELEGLPGGEIRVRLRIHPVDPGCVDYLESLGQVSVSGDTVSLVGRDIDTSSLNKELLRRGYSVAQLQTEGLSLESYFFKLIEEAG